MLTSATREDTHVKLLAVRDKFLRCHASAIVHAEPRGVLTERG